jgi:glycosyltransferase involved in cell wall biosynthesis
VHTHNPKPGVYGRVAARLARVPIVVNTVHGLYALPEDRLRKRVPVYALERFAATFSHAELVQNPEDLPVLRRLRLPESKLRLLGNGIDLARFDIARRDETVVWARHQLGATSPKAIVVGLVGRLVREKGYGEVFAAARTLRGRYPQLVFAVIGPDEPDKADAVTAAERADAAAAGVRFLGERGDLERLYCGMDMYVLASHREGFPRSAMEAAAMGIPIVATNIRGCRQVVDDERTGLLVPPRDVGALAAAIERLVEQPELRETMGKAAAAKAASEFDQQRCIDITLETYEQLSARRRSCA